METTKLSSKGQVVLPSSIRTARKWEAGLELAVEETPEGVLLRPLKPFAPTRIEDVFGSAGYSGKPKSVEDMNAAITAEAKKRRGR